jgi:maleate isomerase
MSSRAATMLSSDHPAERPRIGLLLPSTNSVMEPDLWRELSPAASLHTSRLPLDDVTAVAEERMLALAPAAARDLAPLRTLLTVFGCTSAGAILGRAGEADLLDKLATLTRGPVISVLEASIEMLRRANARSIGLFTPYVSSLAQPVADSFSAEGFAVVKEFSLGLRDNEAIGNLTPPRIQDSVVTAMRDVPVDAIFISCTNLRAAEAVTSMSTHLRVPVISSNSAVARVVQERLADAHNIASTTH